MKTQTNAPPIGTAELRQATELLRQYKAGKARLDRRIIENEEFWRLRHWEHIPEQGTTGLKTKSAWLVNVILSKHADAMDAYPEPACLPRAADDEAYRQLQDSLLDIDAFIDYMLINQYGGNTDWDHHNWFAIRRRGQDSQGFRFLCWDTEIIFESERENVLTTNNGKASPTGIFHNLLKNQDFARRYLQRAREVLAPDGLLGPARVVELWDSLHATIANALYAEAARWGDYRRDVHRWQSAGQLYTVDKHYAAERKRLLTSYFPVRTARVLRQITDYVHVDETGIIAVTPPSPATDDRFYNLNGQPVSRPRHGLFLKNGRIILVR